MDSDANSLWTFAKRWQLSSAQLSEFKAFTQEQDYSHWLPGRWDNSLEKRYPKHSMYGISVYLPTFTMKIEQM